MLTSVSNGILIFSIVIYIWWYINHLSFIQWYENIIIICTTHEERESLLYYNISPLSFYSFFPESPHSFLYHFLSASPVFKCKSSIDQFFSFSLILKWIYFYLNSWRITFQDVESKTDSFFLFSALEKHVPLSFNSKILDEKSCSHSSWCNSISNVFSLSLLSRLFLGLLFSYY